MYMFVFTSFRTLPLGGAAQALERQKEYTDAIRIERDELREEVVNLKDILKVLSQCVNTYLSQLCVVLQSKCETLKYKNKVMFDFLFVQKHGIVLGPDLNINGDGGEAEVEGSPSADPASQPTQDSQTSPTEGNSMLGKTHCELRTSYCMARHKTF